MIQVIGLRKVFGLQVVLDGVGLEVRRGEAVALLGANGAGKTTLLKILATVTRPTRGHAIIGGHDCVTDADGVRRQIGFVGHGSHVYEDLSALENLRFWTTFAGRPWRAEAGRAALADVDLERATDERARTFSAGMKRRLALARCVLMRPSVLLLDEPSAGLDLRAKKWLEAWLQEFKNTGGAIVMATHSFGRELGVADRLVVLAGGRVALDTARGVLTAEDVQRLYALHTEQET